MVEKYVIDKSDIHDLLKGEELPLTQGLAFLDDTANSYISEHIS